MKTVGFIGGVGALLLGAGLITLPRTNGVAAPAPKVTFQVIAAVAKANCMPCHSEEKHSAGVDLSSYEAVMKGNGKGAIVVPKHPEKSLLVKYIDGEKMPRMPYKKPPLKKAQINAVKAWIKAGAKD